MSMEETSNPAVPVPDNCPQCGRPFKRETKLHPNQCSGCGMVLCDGCAHRGQGRCADCEDA